MEIIPYNNKLKARARELRKNMNRAEVILWQHLRGRRMCDYKFNRQCPINNYIVDFYCRNLRLAVEVDGPIHNNQTEEDIFRQRQLESLGVRFLRFSSVEVEQNTQGVLNVIEAWIVSPGGGAREAGGEFSAEGSL